MDHPRTSPAPGFQIAFLIFAVVFLNAPLETYVYSQWQWAHDIGVELGRPLMIVSGGLLLAAIPPVRRRCAVLLAPRIDRGRRSEVVLALAMTLLASMAALGAFALWAYWSGGEPALARAMGEQAPHHIQIDRALLPAHLVMFVFVAGLVAPIAEELAFRGLLYPAWKAAWGWVWAAIASSLVFGLFHGLVWPQFLAGLVFVAAMRRTGSIRTSIYAHALFNLLTWYPLLGQLMLPANRSTGEIGAWWFHLACLATTIVALPLYMWSARDVKLPRAPEFGVVLR